MLGSVPCGGTEEVLDATDAQRKVEVWRWVVPLHCSTLCTAVVPSGAGVVVDRSVVASVGVVIAVGAAALGAIASTVVVG